MTTSSPGVQRIRAHFLKGERARYISHLDVLRHFERCLRRAGLPLAYSQGFTPHPKITFAGPLPLGFLAENEVMDVLLTCRVPVPEFVTRLAAQTTEDLGIVSAAEVPLSLAPAQSALMAADYRIELPDVDPSAAHDAVARFLALETLPWSEAREEKSDRIYDLRAGVLSLGVEHAERGVVLRARLAAGQDLTVRPEQLVLALFPGTAPERCIRGQLYLAESSPARDLWRRKGRFEG